MLDSSSTSSQSAPSEAWAKALEWIKGMPSIGNDDDTACLRKSLKEWVQNIYAKAGIVDLCDSIARFFDEDITKLLGINAETADEH